MSSTDTQNVAHSQYIIGNELFVKLGGVTTKTATAASVSDSYIEQNLNLKIPRLHQLNEFMKVKGNDHPIVLIGGGPSLKDPKVLAELKEYAAKYPTIACGSSNDWCMNNNITPTYATALDPDLITANYFTKLNDETIYLIASQCHPQLFERLNNKKVAMWHCHSESAQRIIDTNDPGSISIGGGCTVGLRTISICILLGYNNIHLFGFDSCLGENEEHHAYGLTDSNEMAGLLGENGKIYTVRMGLDGPGQQAYKCMGYQLAQLHHFNEFYRTHMHIFTPTVHGGGMIAHSMELIKENLKREQEKVQREK